MRGYGFMALWLAVADGRLWPMDGCGRWVAVADGWLWPMGGGGQWQRCLMEGGGR